MKHWRQPAIIVGTAVFFVFLAANAFLGSYSRFIADDYCSSVIGNSHGIIGGMFYLYMTWTGRFSANFLDSMMGPMGVRATPFIPAVVLIIWLVLLVYVLYSIMLSNENRLGLALLSASVFLSTTLIVTPDVVQSLYWEQGMHSVIPPLIIATAFAGLFIFCVRQEPKKPFFYMGTAFFLAFLGGGFSDTFSAVQVMVWAIALIPVLVLTGSLHKRTLLFLVGSGLVGSLLSMLILIAAPGNKFRQAGSPPPPGLLKIVEMTTVSMERYLGGIAVSPVKLLSLAGMVAFFILLGSGKLMGAKLREVSRRMGLQVFLWLPPITLILLEASFAPASYGLSTPPPDRTDIIPTFILVAGLAVWGTMAGQLSQTEAAKSGSRAGYTLRGVILGVCVLFTLSTVRMTYVELMRQPEFNSYATSWDKVDQSIRQAKKEGKNSIFTISLANPAGLQQLSENPNWWVNSCVSQYYGMTVNADYSLKF